MAIRVLPPAVEPMTAADVRLRLKYPRTDQDAALEEWIKAARDEVERYCERGLLTQEWELQAGRGGEGLGGAVAALVAGQSTESHAHGFSHNLTTYRTVGPLAWGGIAPDVFGVVDLPWAAPLQSVLSVTDEQGAVPPAAYAVDRSVEPARLYWLDSARPAGIATIRYRVGFGDTPETVPAALRQTVLALVQQFFLYRAGPAPPSALAATLMFVDGYRVRTFA